MNEFINKNMLKIQTKRDSYILDVIKWVKRGKLLSVGCGNCKEIEKIKKNVPFADDISFYACDITDEGVKYAFKRGFPKNRFKIVDVREKLDYPDNTFDTILFIEVLEHLGVMENTFKELTRVLKPDGHIIITTPLLNHWKKRLKLLLGKSVFAGYHYRFFFRYEIENELKKNGLYIADEIKVGRLPKRFSGHLKALIKIIG